MPARAILDPITTREAPARAIARTNRSDRWIHDLHARAGHCGLDDQGDTARAGHLRYDTQRTPARAGRLA